MTPSFDDAGIHTGEILFGELGVLAIGPDEKRSEPGLPGDWKPEN